MILKLNEKLRDDESGFTLIELMVVVLIIAILIAIAIPAFLGARKRAQRRQAQSSARNALTTEKTYYSDENTQIYTEVAADLSAIEPNFVYTTGVSDDPKEVSIDVDTSAAGASQILQMAVWSKSKDCYFIHEDTSTGTTFRKVQDGAQASCQAATGTPTPGTAGW